MRLFDIINEEQIDEVSMSPGALADFAKTPFAQAMTAGFEAELVIPDAQSDEDGEMEPDYDQDVRCRSTQDIRDFFEGDYNGSRQLDRAIEQIDEEFFEYADEKAYEDFISDIDDHIRDVLKDEDPDLTDSDIDKIIDERDSREYESAKDTAWEKYRDDIDYDQYVRGFFERNYRYMSDVANSVNLDWPYYTGGMGSGNGESSEDIAADISSSIGMPVKASSGYHSAKRGTGYFILEPDSSIDHDAGNDEAGLELVSPPMPLAQCLEYLDKVFAWAEQRGCKTNKSTGFHMGISIPDQSRENVDHLKFTLFLGDEYVLKQFGRESNSYAKSMMKEMSQKLKNLSAGPGRMDAEGMLKTFKDGLNSSAAKFVKTSLTTTHDRYVTVNIKDKYIEVRSAGGNYLGDLDKIKTTLMRYVRAMALAADPEAEKQEYAKKLYKFISPMVRGEDDVIKYFTQYNAGLLPAKGLKGLLKQAQIKRGSKKVAGEKGGLGEGPNLYLFTYYSVVDPADDPERFTANVRGDSRRDAIANFRKKFEEGDYNILQIQDIDITDNSAAQAAAVERHRATRAQASAEASNLYRMTDNYGAYLATITADNVMDAYTKATQKASHAGLEPGTWKLIAPGGRQVYPEPSSRIVSVGPGRSNSADDIPELPGEFVADPMAPGTYIIKYTDISGARHQTAIDANSAVEAKEWFQSNHPVTYHVTDVYRHTA